MISHAQRVFFTLFIAVAAALVCVELGTPLPWMIGPLLITSAASMLGVRTLRWNPFRNTAQWIIGTALGLYFTPQVTALVVSLWWLVLLSILWAVVLGYVYGAWLYQFNAPSLSGLDRPTTYFASLIGGASEMTMLAERENARTDLVAAAHSLRILIVTVIVPFAVQLSGWHGVDISPPPLRTFDGLGLMVLAGLTGLGAGLMHILRRSNPWFIGALLVAIALTANDITLSSIPTWLTNSAQLLIGVSLGVRFTSEFIHTAPRWLASVALGTFSMMLVCVLASFAFSALTDLPLATMVLASAPGGIAEMAITAKVLQLGVAVVTALQACRVISVLFLAEPLYHWIRRKGGLA